MFDPAIWSSAFCVLVIIALPSVKVPILQSELLSAQGFGNVLL
jgi:hypothetical protein